jgi:hypothetical protein
VSTSRTNPSTIAPNPLCDEQAPTTYDVAQAQNSRRKGESFAQEGLGFQQEYHQPFYESVRDSDTGASHHDVEAKIAGQADGRGLLGSGRAVPSWNAVDGAERSAFVQGQAGAEQYGVSATPERPGNVFQSQIAPPDGGRWRNRRNEANVR